MNTAKTLSRPLAQRVAGLGDMIQRDDEPDIPSNVIEAAVDALERGETHYTDRPGIPEFRGLVSSHLEKQYGLQIDPKEVTITCGSTEARFATMTLFAESESQVLCPGDSSRIDGAVHLVDAEVIHTITESNTISVIYITPDDEHDIVQDLLAKAADKDWWVVWDMSFASNKTDFHPAQNEKLASHVVTINTLSHHMAGWRLGWMAGS
jgi:aspartate/methionine/tyrosine aminotransferase